MLYEQFIKALYSILCLCILPNKAYWTKESKIKSFCFMCFMMSPYYFDSCLIVHFGAMLLGVQIYMSVCSEFYLFPLSLQSGLVQHIQLVGTKIPHDTQGVVKQKNDKM